MHLLKEGENCHFLHKVKPIKVSTVSIREEKQSSNKSKEQL